MNLNTPPRRLLGYLLLAGLLTQGLDLWAIHAAHLRPGDGTTLGVGIGLLIAGGACLVAGLLFLLAFNREDTGTADGCVSATFYNLLGIGLLTVGGILAIVGVVLWAVEQGNRVGVYTDKSLRGRARRAQLRAYAFLARRNPGAAERFLRRRLAKAGAVASEPG